MAGTISDSLREFWNLWSETASLTQEVKYFKVDPLSLKTFEGNPSITSFTV